VPARRRPLPPAPAGLPGPDALEVAPRSLRAGATLCRTLAVTGYPREVGPGWLEPLVTFPGPVDVSLHVEPIPAPVAAERLRRQLARLESSRRLDATRERLADLDVEVAAEDAHELARRVARGEGRLFRVGLYVTVRGRDEAELDAETARVRSLLDSLLLDAYPVTFRALQGWVTTLPLGWTSSSCGGRSTPRRWRRRSRLPPWSCPALPGCCWAGRCMGRDWCCGTGSRSPTTTR